MKNIKKMKWSEMIKLTKEEIKETTGKDYFEENGFWKRIEKSVFEDFVKLTALFLSMLFVILISVELQAIENILWGIFLILFCYKFIMIVIIPILKKYTYVLFLLIYHYINYDDFLSKINFKKKNLLLHEINKQKIFFVKEIRDLSDMKQTKDTKDELKILKANKKKLNDLYNHLELINKDMDYYDFEEKIQNIEKEMEKINESIVESLNKHLNVF